MPSERCPFSVLHVSQAAEVGGLERVVQALAVGQRRRGHTVRVAAIGGAPDSCSFSQGLRTAGVDVASLEVSTYSVLAERRFVRSLCQRYEPDLVHTHGYRPDIVDGPVAIQLGIPVVATEHGTGWEGLKGRVYEYLQIRSLRSFDSVVAVSRPIAARLEQGGVRSTNVHVVPNAWGDDVDFVSRRRARQRLGLRAEGFAIGWVGRMIEAKGCDLFLRAMADLAHLDLSAAVIGDGPLGNDARGLADSLALGDRVAFLGLVPDAASHLKAFDVLVMSSRSEGSPIVLLEAMAAGVPVITTAVGGLPDMVSADEVRFVQPESHSALAEAIAEAAADFGPYRERANLANQRLSADYELEPWLERYEAIYEEVLRRSER